MSGVHQFSEEQKAQAQQLLNAQAQQLAAAQQEQLSQAQAAGYTVEQQQQLLLDKCYIIILAVLMQDYFLFL